MWMDVWLKNTGYGFKQRKNGQVFDSCHPLKVSVTSLSGLMTVLMYNLFFKKDLWVIWSVLVVFFMIRKVLKVLFCSSNERTWEILRPFHLYNPFKAEVVWWRREGFYVLLWFSSVNLHQCLVKKSFFTKLTFPKCAPSRYLLRHTTQSFPHPASPKPVVLSDPFAFLVYFDGM